MGFIPYSKYNTRKGGSTYEKFTYKNFGSDPYDIVNGYAPYSMVKWMSGYKFPEWKSHVARHWSASTPFEGYEDQVKSRDGFVRKQTVIRPGLPEVGIEYLEYTGGIRYSYNTYDPDWLHVWRTEADNEALRKFVSQIRAAQTTFQGGTFVAELGKTIAQIKNPAKSLRTYFSRRLPRLQKLKPSGVSRRNVSKVKLREAIADTWLEIQFGARPLINDVDNAVQAVAESGVMVDNQYVSCVGAGTKQVVFHTGPDLINSSPGISFMMKKSEKMYVRYLGEVDVGTYAMSNMRRMGFDPSSWLPTAWEIVPWSFLIDYFSNVGDIISAASLARSGVTWINRTEVREYHWEAYDFRPVNCTSSNDYFYEFCGAFAPPVFSHKRKKVYRSDYTTSSLIPTLEFSIPGTGTRWLNIAALYAGRREMRSRLRR